MTTKLLTTAVLSLSLIGIAGPLQAGQRGGSSAGRAAPRGGATTGHAVPRTGAPPQGGGSYYRPGYGRPYYYAPRYGYYGSYGYPYGYYPYGVGFSFGFGFGYPYGYAAYGYPGYAYGYPGGGYVAGGYAGNVYGGVRITDAPPDAQVYADGYYVGVADDFDGTFQRLNLEPGPHKIEVVKQQGQPPIAFDVNVQPGQTVTFRAN